MRVIKDSEYCILPDGNARIWRYLSFAKFVALLERRTLFFCRIDKLEDEYEGSYPREEPPGDPSEAWREMTSSVRRRIRVGTAVNCWHLNEHESRAMWALYVGAMEGVAIQSRVSRLVTCLEESPFLVPDVTAVYVTKVHYTDYEPETEPWNLASVRPQVSKHVANSYEQELRAAIFNYNRPFYIRDGVGFVPAPEFQDIWTQGGLHIDVDLGRLIEAVYVAPRSPGWFLEIVKRQVERHAPGIPVLQSILDCPPNF